MADVQALRLTIIVTGPEASAWQQEMVECARRFAEKHTVTIMGGESAQRTYDSDLTPEGWKF
jgi:hypothetical protein